MKKKKDEDEEKKFITLTIINRIEKKYKNYIHELMKICFKFKCERQTCIFFKRKVHFENCFENDSFEKTIRFTQKTK